MSLSTLLEALRGRRMVEVARRTAHGLEVIVVGRLEPSRERGVVTVADGAGAVHRVHTHPGLVIREVRNALHRQ